MEAPPTQPPPCGVFRGRSPAPALLLVAPASARGARVPRAGIGSGPPGSAPLPAPREPRSAVSRCSSLPDLRAAFEIICDNVGKDWRRLARQLGVSDAKIDAIEERHPRNLMEQVRELLRVWKSAAREDAGVAPLVAALRACRLNLVADLIEEDLARASGT
ncbi:PREDICTED: FAS-associated death domain protein [Condylura cristata]|uniref:FAS-associated death domain protein n=1 Tax=Condylura cristata TaxID=143302 RepID=UPI0006430587|nr:PREDICTED: FAS-associated death domain protein [Condylura cristata]